MHLEERYRFCSPACLLVNPRPSRADGLREGHTRRQQKITL